MKSIKSILLIIFTITIVVACSNSKTKMTAKINTLEKELKDSKNAYDKKKSEELMSTYLAYTETYKKDTIVPSYLFKAGEICMNLNKSQKALELFDRVSKEFPDFKKAGDCLFLKGFIYENNLQDINNARTAYMDFIKKFPTHQFADDAQILIQNLGKSPEELIKEFEAKNQEKLNAGK